MEATAVSMGKAVLDGALGYAMSKAAEEIALQLGVERDVDFITDELQMMQSFLEMADEDSDQNKVFMTWVKQIRDLAYKVEDSLMDFGLHSEKKPFWGCIPRSLSDRRRIAKEVKELRAKVEDVSNRNLRYRLVKDHKDSSASKATAAEKQANVASAAMLGINEATLATLKQEKTEVDLHQLIISEEEDLRVISLWGTSGDHGKTSAIQTVYNDQKVLKKFRIRAWVRLIYPFNPQEFLRSLVRQFYENSHDMVGKQESETSVGANIFEKMEKMDQSDLIREFNTQLCSNSYLIVINDLSTIEEWHCIKMYFPNNKKQSRIIVSTQNGEIASLCTENPYQVSELQQVSCDQTIYLFHKKNTEEHDMTREARLTDIEENLKATSEIQQEDKRPNNASEDKVSNSTAVKKFDRSGTMALVDGVLTGRETEKSIVIKLVGQPDNNQKVISIWGMGGLGKTTLVRSVYQSQELASWKHAWTTALRPFNPEVLLRDLALQLQKSIQEDSARATSTTERKIKIAMMQIQELKVELARLLQTQKCLVVLDDISSTYEWDLVKGCLDNAGRIIVTTREKNIAKHCSIESKNMYSLEGLKDDAALDLFKKKNTRKKQLLRRHIVKPVYFRDKTLTSIKVSKDNTENINFIPAMMEQARIILKKCDGLPLAISTVGGFLATKPKTAIEWRMMNDRISAELAINPEFRTIKTVIMRSYDGLPYYLKSAFLYLSIFQEDQKIRLKRLVRRWIAEGYSRDMHGITAEQLGHSYFDELLNRSMILPGEDANHYSGKIDSFQLHDIIREICILKAREENLVFTLEDGCCLSSTHGPIRHLVIGSNWKRDGDALPSVLDLSHIRSLTVFGKWRPFFISENMRFLRVLDLEDTLGMRYHHLDRVGQLHHLKYLSLRGCYNILCLPDSLGNLGHLQTLDIRGTRIIRLPATITKLGKLQNLRAPGHIYTSGGNVKEDEDILDMYRDYCAGIRPNTCAFYSQKWSRGLLRPQILGDGLNMHDLLNLFSFNQIYNYGAEVPRGFGQLKSLHTLSGADVFEYGGNAKVKELRELTELRKLGVGGISGDYSMEFWSAIAGHYHLRSLSVRSSPFLDGCLGEGLSPPSWLESLKLYGELVRVTDWIHKLQNLRKLVLEDSILEEDDDIQAIGVLPNISVLRLKGESFMGKQLHFQNSAFQSLVVLELDSLDNLESVLFEQNAMPRLELLQIGGCFQLNEISGLSVLTSLKEIRLGGYDAGRLKELLLNGNDMKHVIVNTV